jgi:RNA polymerase sigma factor (sigma-70 family)
MGPSEEQPVLERTEFEEFVARVEPRLRRALVAAYGPQRGSDALAAALAYAWTNWTRIAQMEFPAAYLYRVGQSETRPRRERILRDHVVGIEQWVEPRLLSELRQLSPRQRTAVVLVHGFDWSVAEVAELTGTAPTTVHNHLTRGLERLRTRLDGDHD